MGNSQREEETVVELNQAIKTFWFIVATAAYFQSLFPNWVTQSCPRITTEEGRMSWMFPYMSPEEQRRQYVAVDWQSPPISAQIQELAIHMDVHRFSINDHPPLDGLWEIGLGFLYLGPPDPDIEDRQGFGIVFYWIRSVWSHPQVTQRRTALPAIFDEAAVVPDHVYRTLGRGET